MAYKDIKPGKYKAVPILGKFGESGKNKTPGVGIKFQFESSDGVFEELAWTGWLTEKAMERTFKTLALCGYDESKGNLPDGTIPREYFDPKAEVEIDVQEEQYLDKEGTPKTAMKIAWVNKLGGSGFAVSSNETDVKAMLKSIGGLKAHMAAARADLGLGKPAAKPEPSKSESSKPAATKPAPEKTKEESATSVEPGIDESEDIPW